MRIFLENVFQMIISNSMWPSKVKSLLLYLINLPPVTNQVTKTASQLLILKMVYSSNLLR